MPTRKRKILIVELWGLGDLTFSTPLLRQALSDAEVHLLGKPYAKELLHPTFSGLNFIYYDAPWTAYRGKYRLWTWNWKELFRVVHRLRKLRFDAAISVRRDPRDHTLMWLSGARERYGFPRQGSEVLLTHPLARTRERQHKVEDWLDIGRAIGLPGIDSARPHLRSEGYFSYHVDALFSRIRKPVITLHAGARIAVRRWPEAHFAQVIERLRQQFDFHLNLIPDPDGYGLGLQAYADSTIPHLSVRELVDVLGRSDLILCNDSGPGHIAACCERPVISIFGPSDPDWFRPWGESTRVITREICPWRPCFDYCLFPEPYCMTKLMPQTVWPDIHEQIVALIGQGRLPKALLKE